MVLLIVKGFHEVDCHLDPCRSVQGLGGQDCVAEGALIGGEGLGQVGHDNMLVECLLKEDISQGNDLAVWSGLNLNDGIALVGLSRKRTRARPAFFHFAVSRAAIATVIVTIIALGAHSDSISTYLTANDLEVLDFGVLSEKELWRTLGAGLSTGAVETVGTAGLASLSVPVGTSCAFVVDYVVGAS